MIATGPAKMRPAMRMRRAVVVRGRTTRRDLTNPNWTRRAHLPQVLMPARRAHAPRAQVPARQLPASTVDTTLGRFSCASQTRQVRTICVTFSEKRKEGCVFPFNFKDCIYVEILIRGFVHHAR